MAIRVVTDSTCDLSSDVLAAHRIVVVPLYINFGRESFLDGVQMSHDQFYTRLLSDSAQPSTSVPGPGVFHKTYADVARDGADGIVSIHIGERLSAVANVARMAAEENPPVPVRVLDSGNLTLGVGLMALRAAEAANAGASMDEVVAIVQDMRKRTSCFAGLNTLEYMRRSGRISNLQAGLGSWLQLKPILKMHDGEVATERVRTRAKSLRRVIELVAELGPLSDLAVVHTNAPEEAEHLRQMADGLFPDGQSSLTGVVTPVIGAHIGPGAVGFVAVTKSAG